jgi:hypothetical protein
MVACIFTTASRNRQLRGGYRAGRVPAAWRGGRGLQLGLEVGTGLHLFRERRRLGSTAAGRRGAWGAVAAGDPSAPCPVDASWHTVSFCGVALPVNIAERGVSPIYRFGFPTQKLGNLPLSSFCNCTRWQLRGLNKRGGVARLLFRFGCPPPRSSPRS